MLWWGRGLFSHKKSPARVSIRTILRNGPGNSKLEMVKCSYLVFSFTTDRLFKLRGSYHTKACISMNRHAFRDFFFRGDEFEELLFCRTILLIPYIKWVWHMHTVVNIFILIDILRWYVLSSLALSLSITRVMYKSCTATSLMLCSVQWSEDHTSHGQPRRCSRVQPLLCVPIFGHCFVSCFKCCTQFDAVGYERGASHDGI